MRRGWRRRDLRGGWQSVATAVVVGSCLGQIQSEGRRVPSGRGRRGVMEDEVQEVSSLWSSLLQLLLDDGE